MAIRKIRYKIALVTIIIIVFLTTLLTVIDFISHYNSGIRNYKELGKALVENSAYQVEHFAYINDYVELQRIVNSLVKSNSDIHYAFIIDPDTKVLVHSFEKGFPYDLLKINNKPEFNSELLITDDESFYDFSYPIYNGRLGILRIGISRERLFRELRYEFITKILLLIGFILMGILSSILFSKHLTKPINNLVQASNSIAKGNFQCQILPTTKDEIGVLTQSFNIMCSELNNLTQKLHQKINQLNTRNHEFESLYKEYFNLSEELSIKINELQEINLDLTEAKNRAEEYDRLKTAFLANLSHEIRTPMNGIIGFATILNSRKLTLNQQKKYIENIEKSSKRMLDIIQNLVDISMIESGQVNVYKEKFNINQLLDDLYEFFKPQAELKGIELVLEKDLQFQKRELFADRGKLSQVISNLLNNALKFTEKGSIEFGFSVENESLRFYVKDQGVGIPSGMREIIFERFRQAKNTQKGKTGGTGLGLSISKAFIEMHNGTIWVESKQGRGSTFYFTIPLLNQFNSEEQAGQKAVTVKQ